MENTSVPSWVPRCIAVITVDDYLHHIPIRNILTNEKTLPLFESLIALPIVNFSNSSADPFDDYVGICSRYGVDRLGFSEEEIMCSVVFDRMFRYLLFHDCLIYRTDVIAERNLYVPLQRACTAVIENQGGEYSLPIQFLDALDVVMSFCSQRTAFDINNFSAATLSKRRGGVQDGIMKAFTRHNAVKFIHAWGSPRYGTLRKLVEIAFLPTKTVTSKTIENWCKLPPLPIINPLLLERDQQR